MKSADIYMYRQICFPRRSRLAGNALNHCRQQQRAPEGLLDDLAMSFVLGAQAVMLMARHTPRRLPLLPLENSVRNLMSKAPPGLFMTDRDTGGRRMSMREQMERAGL